VARRRWIDVPLRYKALAVLAVPMVPLIASAVLVLGTARQERQAQGLITHTLDVKNQIDVVLAIVVDIEAVNRGLILTGEASLLRDFRETTRHIHPEVDRLAALVADNPVQVEQVRAVTMLMERQPLTDLLETASSQPGSPMDLLVNRQTTIAELRHDMTVMQDVEDRLLTERVRETERAQSRLVMVTLGGAGVGLVGGIAAAVVFTGGLARRVGRARESAVRVAHGLPPLTLATMARDELGELFQGIRDAAALLKARENELHQRVSELAAVNQELEAFTYSVSHDLRAPLRHVTGFAALLERSAGPKLTDDEHRRMLAIIEAGGRMGRLIDDLLAFSRMGRTPVSKRRVALNDLVREAQLEASSGLAGRHVSWCIQPLPEVDADPAMLRLVFVNLISNALKYSRTRPESKIHIGTIAGADDEAVLFVRDNGVGFDMQYAAKLFGVFSRLHSADDFEGTGIGLANVRRIINRHGGRTWAEGAVDEGATFYFSLPSASTSEETREILETAS
jgi:signal transduction histidine kinase